MNGIALANVFCVGGAFLGLWMLLRFPGWAPASILGATGALLGALAVAAIVPTLLRVFIEGGGRAGAAIALFALVLPTFTAVFWAVGCLFRACYGHLRRGF